ncbi:hypothetical protein BKA62DRAFT_828980 [Auriculariales sp. MPI-PUGE-AT-0066]|nr:hypothetical protein BKA62DRAFT_828980 [Auriculariales sp. MPI-PUGE-AT-0066]
MQSDFPINNQSGATSPSPGLICCHHLPSTPERIHTSSPPLHSVSRKQEKPKVSNCWMLYKNDFPTRYPEVCALEKIPAQRMRIAARFWDKESPSIKAEYEHKYLSALISVGGKVGEPDSSRRAERNGTVTAARRAKRAASGEALKPRSLTIVQYWLDGLRGTTLINAVRRWEETHAKRRSGERTAPLSALTSEFSVVPSMSPHPASANISSTSLAPSPVPTPGASAYPALPLSAGSPVPIPIVPPPQLPHAPTYGLGLYTPGNMLAPAPLGYLSPSIYPPGFFYDYFNNLPLGPRPSCSMPRLMQPSLDATASMFDFASMPQGPVPQLMYQQSPFDVQTFADNSVSRGF